MIDRSHGLLFLNITILLTAAGCEVLGAAGNLIEAKALSTHAECDAALLDVNLAGQET